MIRRDAVLTAALAAFLFFAAVNLQAGWMYAVDALLVGLLAASWLSAAWSVRGLRVVRTVAADVHEGDEVTITLELRTRSLPRFFLDVTDHLPGLTAYHTRVPVVWPGEAARLRYGATALRRGVHAGGHCIVQSTGLAGWFSARREISVPSALTVFPRIWPLRSSGMPGSRESREPIVPRPVRTGLDVYGVRDYREGDSLRHVHWRSTARRGSLVIREYERDAHDATVLLLDVRPAGGAGSPDVFEDLVRAAASVADALAREGHPVSITGSINGTPVDAGPGRAAVMRWLAGVHADASVPPARVYEAMCAPDTPVVVFTADPGSVEYFAARGIPHTAVVLRPGEDLRARLEQVL